MKPVKDNEDSAVSEIIGALLLFAIGTTVLTGFILWYVPSTGMTNDQGYQSATQSAFTTLDSKILSPSLAPGSAVSQSFPLGVSGAPPFSSPTDSSLCYSNDFSASMNEKFNLSYYNRLPVKSNIILASANATASNIYNNIYADNQFMYSVNFVENGLTYGNYWTVILAGRSQSSSSNLISFSFPQGTYSYQISTNSGQLMSTKEGTVVVNNSINVPVTFFTSKLNGILAENNGTSGDLNSVNLENQIPTFNSNTINVNVLPNWLCGTYNSSIKANELGSQAFDVYSKEPLNYYLYYLMPSNDFGYQYCIGKYSVVTYISSTPFGKNITAPSYYNNSNQVSSYIKVTLAKPIFLNSGTYYLNFYEHVNEGKVPNQQKSFLPLAHATGSTVITTSQWQYGPTEFIGVMSSSEVSAGVGNSIAFKAEYYETYCGGRGYDNFTITSDYVSDYSNMPYVFVVGYNVTGEYSSETFNETGLPTTAGEEWNVSINGKCYTGAAGKNITICQPEGSYTYSVFSSTTEISTPSGGMINITGVKANNVVNVTFSTPRGSNPKYYGITNGGSQQFILKQKEKFNYISLYLYNFTIPPSSYKNGNLNNSIFVTISNHTYSCKKELNVNDTGWTQIYFYTNAQFRTLYAGTYTITVSAVGGSNNTIGWGFSTSGGFDNYLEIDSSNLLFTDTNISKSSNITDYNLLDSFNASNQVFMFTAGFYNFTESSTLLHENLTFTKTVSGEILSNGFTQFTYQAVFAIQDGSSLEASKGVTYATVNPLPIQIAGNNSHIVFDSNIYSIDIIKAIPTSISGDGSTILSIALTNRSTLNYTVNDSYFFSYGSSSIYAKVVNIKLTSFNYTIASQFSKYWADSFYTQLPVNDSHSNDARFNIAINRVNAFNVTLGNDMLYFSMNKTALPTGISLYSISNLYQSYLVTQV